MSNRTFNATLAGAFAAAVALASIPALAADEGTAFCAPARLRRRCAARA